MHAIWHSRKYDLSLSASEARPLLAEDAEFQAFLSAHPFIDRVRSARGEPMAA
jgi:hypothetical protein